MKQLNSKFHLMSLFNSLNKQTNQKEDIKIKIAEITELLNKQNEGNISQTEQAEILRRLKMIQDNMVE